MQKRYIQGGLLGLCLMGMLLAAGCATTPEDADSDLPWNTPQPWEAAPTLPGFGGDYR